MTTPIDTLTAPDIYILGISPFHSSTGVLLMVWSLWESPSLHSLYRQWCFIILKNRNVKMQKFQEAIQYLLCWNGSKDTYIDLNRSLIHSAVKKKTSRGNSTIYATFSRTLMFWGFFRTKKVKLCHDLLMPLEPVFSLLFWRTLFS